MNSFVGQLFDTEGFPPRWSCGTAWSEDPWVGWLHVISDIAIFAAYLAIPIVIVFFIVRRKDAPFPPVLWLFSAFILSCGFVHLTEAVIFWEPMYRFSGVLKGLTAVISWATVITLIPAFPRALALPGLARINEQLRDEIARREQAEAELNELAAIVESSQDAITRADLNGVLTNWNDAARKIYGYTAEEMIGQPVSVFAPPDRKDEPKQLVERLNRGEVIEPFETIRIRKDGKRLMMSLAISGIRDDRGELVALSAISRDVTEQHRLKKRFQAAVESAPYGLLIASSDGRIQMVNPRLATMFGHDREELTGSSLERLIPDRFHDNHRQMLADFFTSPETRRMASGREVFALHKSGREFPVEITLTKIETAEGVNVLGSIVDITERKRTEAAERRYLAELQRSNEDLDAFAYSASHDLKAPLRAIKQLAQWIDEDLESDAPPKVKKRLQQMTGRVDRMDKLLEDILVYSRAGRTAGEIDTVDVQELVESVWAMLPISDGFTLQIPERLPQLVSESIPLQQCFLNLISNAIKHHDQPHGTVQVTSSESGEWLEFQIADDGPGIPAEHHQRIFEMFRTLQPRDKVEGSGVGLSLVKKYVELAGGTITVQPGPARGTVFRFTWPKTPREI